MCRRANAGGAGKMLYLSPDNRMGRMYPGYNRLEAGSSSTGSGAPDHDLLKGVKFPLIMTLDTSKKPKGGDGGIAGPVMPAAEIAKLKTRLAQIESGRTGKPTAKRSIKLRRKRAG